MEDTLGKKTIPNPQDHCQHDSHSHELSRVPPPWCPTPSLEQEWWERKEYMAQHLFSGKWAQTQGLWLLQACAAPPQLEED